MGRDQAEEVQQLVHPSRVHVYAVLLLVVRQVPAVCQPKCVHHVRYVRKEFLHIGQTSVRPVAEERFARGGRRQGIKLENNKFSFITLMIN